jgi:hypothetical protein
MHKVVRYFMYLKDYCCVNWGDQHNDIDEWRFNNLMILLLFIPNLHIDSITGNSLDSIPNTNK